MKAAAELDAIGFVRHFDPSAQLVEDDTEFLTWSSKSGDDWSWRERLYVSGDADVYVVELHFSQMGEPSVKGTVVPIDDFDGPATEFFEWNPKGAPWFREFSIARDRMPKSRRQLGTAFNRMLEANRKLVHRAIQSREATGAFPEALAPLTTFDAKTAALFAVRPHPRVRLGNGRNERHLGKWFARLGPGWFVRELTDWDVAYVYVGDDGVRYANGYLLQEIFDAHPHLLYEPLDPDLQPQLHALADRQGEEQEPEQYDAAEAMLLALLRKAGRESELEWRRVTPTPAPKMNAPPFIDTESDEWWESSAL